MNFNLFDGSGGDGVSYLECGKTMPILLPGIEYAFGLNGGCVLEYE